MYRTIKTQQTGRVLLAQLSNPPHAFMNEAMVLDLKALVDREGRSLTAWWRSLTAGSMWWSTVSSSPPA